MAARHNSRVPESNEWREGGVDWGDGVTFWKVELLVECEEGLVQLPIVAATVRGRGNPLQAHNLGKKIIACSSNFWDLGVWVNNPEYTKPSRAVQWVWGSGVRPHNPRYTRSFPAAKRPTLIPPETQDEKK